MVETAGHFQPLGPSFEVASAPNADLAAIRLPSESLDWGLAFLELEIQPVPGVRPGEIETFIAMGFPVRETEFIQETDQVALKRINYWTFEAPDAYRKLGKDRALWLATK